MDENLSVTLDNHRTLMVTEISRETFEDQDLHALGSDGGLFVVLENCAEGRFDVLAKVACAMTGAALLELFAHRIPNRAMLSLVKS
jgi:hypothetical protein